MKTKDYTNKMVSDSDKIIKVDKQVDEKRVRLMHPTQGHFYDVKLSKLEDFYRIMNADKSWKVKEK